MKWKHNKSGATCLRKNKTIMMAIKKGGGKYITEINLILIRNQNAKNKIVLLSMFPTIVHLIFFISRARWKMFPEI